jgi:hypothetical protein
MAKIYIVTSGEYSDYCIQAVFSTREKAEEYIQQHGTDYRIEPCGVDEEIVKKNRVWRVSLNFKTFKLKSCTLGWSEDGYLSKEKDTFQYLVGWDREKYIEQYIEADCMDRAIKIANERIAQIKANQDMLYARAFAQIESPYCGRPKYPLVRYRTGERVK